LSHHFGINLSEQLKNWPFRCLVTEKAVDNLDRIQREWAQGNDRLSSIRVGNQLVPQITSGDILKQAADRMGSFVSTIREHCEIVEGSTLPEFDIDLKDFMVRACGRASAESIRLAATRNAVLWTDDNIVALLATDKAGAKRVWTQIAIGYLATRVDYDPPIVTRLALSLLQMKYDFTAISVTDALFAAREAKWSVDIAPFKFVLDQLARPNIRVEGIAAVTGAIIMELWFSPVLSLQAQDVTQRILDRLGQREDGLKIIRDLHAAVDRMFGLHVVGAANVKRIIENWLRFNESGNIIALP
jgi:hypothetical protein